ncbi:MAG: PIN domain nuclease [Frankiaceae bacterium]|nr:PIN domain nuclease [Frankiaceae bacterium]
MAVSGWLIDKSAIVRLADSKDATEWADRIDRGLVSITSVTRLEIGFSARSGGDLRTASRRAPLSKLPLVYLTPAIEDRAIAVQQALSDQGQHRAPGVPDLLIAATAELADLVVLYVDKDYELIAEVTGQLIERLAITA